MRYAQLRKTFGKPIAQHQAIQLKLAEMAIRTEAAIALTYNAAAAYDEGRRCDMEAGMAKYAASEAAVENALEAMRIHGAYGYSKELHIERYYRDAPLLVHRRGHQRAAEDHHRPPARGAEPGVAGEPDDGPHVMRWEMKRASGGPTISTMARRTVCSAITNDRSTLLEAAIMATEFMPPGLVAR